MDTVASNGWWVVVGLLVIAELASGSFYLLMLALGAAAAGVSGFFGLGMTAQVVVAAVCGGGTTALWHWFRARNPQSLPAQQNIDVNLDIGQEVWVDAWNQDGSTKVSYRGAEWTARLAPECSAQTGKHFIFSVDGNRLVLKPVPIQP